MEESAHILSCNISVIAGEIDCNGTIYFSEDKVPPSNVLFWVYLLVYVFLVLFAGLVSGLTIGFMSLDVMGLEVLKRGGKPREKKYASRIIRIVKQHHLLLVTLLLANAAAVESMPIFLNKITNEVVAIIVSVTAVLIFGEIVPQALCSRFGLAIGYYCAPLVVFLMILFFVIAFPIAKLLDCILGKDHGTFFRRTELKELVQIHMDDKEKENEEPLTNDEVLILKGALDMKSKTVQDIMTPLQSVFMLSHDDIIGHVNMEKIITYGHSRIPIYNQTRDNIVGLLLVKKMIKLDPDDNTPISELAGAMIPPPSCSNTTPLYDILNQFQTGKSHMYLVYDETAVDPLLVGIVTLEDVIEELIGEEIVDETDVYVDVHRRITVARARVDILRHRASDPVDIGEPKEKEKKKDRLAFLKRFKKSHSEDLSVVQNEELSRSSSITTQASVVMETESSSYPAPIGVIDDTAPLLINASSDGDDL